MVLRRKGNDGRRYPLVDLDDGDDHPRVDGRLDGYDGGVDVEKWDGIWVGQGRRDSGGNSASVSYPKICVRELTGQLSLWSCVLFFLGCRFT